MAPGTPKTNKKKQKIEILARCLYWGLLNDVTFRQFNFLELLIYL
jgi:hypothetical protein